jgi:hypothetical protein
MNYHFTDGDFPGGKGKPAWFHKKTTTPQKRRAWFDEYNRRASNGQDNRGESHAPDAVSCGIERMPMTVLERIPRMADFAVWATACEAALWPDGTFMSAYAGNIAAALDSVVEADPVASALRALKIDHDSNGKVSGGRGGEGHRTASEERGARADKGEGDRARGAGETPETAASQLKREREKREGDL